MIFFGKGMISLIPATVYDIFYRSDNNMWAQKVIDFVTLTWISRRTYKKNWYCDIFTYTYTNIDIYAILILEVPDSMAVHSTAASRLTKNSPPDCFCLYETVPYSRTQPVYAGIWFREALRNDFIRNSFVGYWFSHSHSDSPFLLKK